MGISETIMAAGIGATATITTALFQLYTMLRVKNKAESRPKRTNMLRSSLSLAALMVASAAGGYVYAEFRQQQALDDARAMREEFRSMRDELNAKLQMLALTTERLQHAVDGELPVAVGPTSTAGCDDNDERVAPCGPAPHRQTAPAGLHLAEAAGPPEPAAPSPSIAAQ
jgi:hypothetical protein